MRTGWKSSGMHYWDLIQMNKTEGSASMKLQKYSWDVVARIKCHLSWHCICRESSCWVHSSAQSVTCKSNQSHCLTPGSHLGWRNSCKIKWHFCLEMLGQHKLCRFAQTGISSKSQISQVSVWRQWKLWMGFSGVEVAKPTLELCNSTTHAKFVLVCQTLFKDCFQSEAQLWTL